MFVVVSETYVKWFISIVTCTVPVADRLIAKVWILTLSYKSTPSFVKIFFSLKKSTSTSQFTVIESVNIIQILNHTKFSSIAEAPFSKSARRTFLCPPETAK